jgi:hypothetical protein
VRNKKIGEAMTRAELPIIRKSTIFALIGMIAWLSCAAANHARAADVKGINIALDPLKLLPPNSEPLAQFEQDDSRRIGLSDAAGFKLVRLRFRIANVREEADQIRRDLRCARCRTS